MNLYGGVDFFKLCFNISDDEITKSLTQQTWLIEHYARSFRGIGKINLRLKSKRLKIWTTSKQNEEMEEVKKLQAEMRQRNCPWLTHFDRCPIFDKQKSCPFAHE